MLQDEFKFTEIVKATFSKTRQLAVRALVKLCVCVGNFGRSNDLFGQIRICASLEVGPWKYRVVKSVAEFAPKGLAGKFTRPDRGQFVPNRSGAKF